MIFTTAARLETYARTVRRKLELVFSFDTKAPGSMALPMSAGHCAAVAVVFYRLTGGEFVSTKVEGQSHWFNRVRCGGVCLDVDLTGDQFGRPQVQVAAPGTIYPDTRVRSIDELRDETLIRAEVLMDRLLRNEPPGAA